MFVTTRWIWSHIAASYIPCMSWASIPVAFVNPYSHCIPKYCTWTPPYCSCEIICLCKCSCNFEWLELLRLVSALKAANSKDVALALQYKPTYSTWHFLFRGQMKPLCLLFQGLCKPSLLCNTSVPIIFNVSPLICITTASVLSLKWGRAWVHLSVCFNLYLNIQTMSFKYCKHIKFNL